MSSSYGENIRLTIFGQSHSPAIGVTVEGIPAGERIDMAALEKFLARRAPGQNALSTARREDDLPEFVSGIKDNVTCGAPITAIIRNRDARSKDYSQYRTLPRPGHADYTAAVKFDGHQDFAGGGHFSGRMTAPLCIAGGIVLQLLEKEGIKVITRIAQIGLVSDVGALTPTIARRSFPVASHPRANIMRSVIAKAKETGDSVGGVIECSVLGLPVGLGDPMFDGMENRIARIVFGIPAVKGLEFGDGFALAGMYGSEANDAFCVRDGKIQTETNHCGGILGGITNGMPLSFRVAFKPTPSIGREQKSVDLETREEKTLQIIGRHDPCVVPRALPVVEAAAAIAVFDALLQRRKESKWS